MNLQELIIWIFALMVALGGAVNGLQAFGIFGLVFGGVIGLFVGLVLGVLIAKLIFFFELSKKRN